ncbi:glycosyltransferase [candidate division KSB1 bacterium]
MDIPKKTESEQVAFYEKCYEKFKMALEVTGEVKHYFDIGSTSVCLLFAGDRMIPHMTPALEHLRIPETNTPDATLCIWDSESSNVEMAPPPCEWSSFTDRGDIWGFNSKRIKTAFHWGEFSVNVMDLSTNTGIYWVENPGALPYWVKSSPLRTLIHWWMEKNGCQLLHAAAVGTDQGAILISGKGGAGKSTTALTCLQSGLSYISDDYLITSVDPEPTVYSLYSTAKLNVDEMHKMSFFERFAKDIVKKGQDKTILYLFPDLKQQIALKMPLRAIFIPEIKPQKESMIAPVPFWAVQGAVSFTTMSQLPNVGRHTHNYICNLCNSLPIFELELGSDLNKIPPTIENFLANPSNYGPDKIISKKEVTDPKEMPLISVITPVYNGEEFIKEAIDNILSQEYPALEIIIVNDGSTDNSEKIIKELPYDIRYFYQVNAGPASARNRGIRDASGEFIAFLDADDLWPENNLKLLVKELILDPKLQLIKGHAQLLEKNEKTSTWDFIGNPRESFPGYIGSALYRKTVFNEVGLYDTTLKFGEDSDWFKRAKELEINMKNIDEVTLYVRRHGGNMTEGKDIVELNALKVFKKSLDRTRKTEKKRKTIPEISVIIPVYNAEKYIAEALESVLNQSVKPFEIIVIDDGSTDDTIKEIEKFGSQFQIIRQENKGTAAARNAGINISKGSFLTFIDADDLWMPIHQDILLGAFDEDPDLKMVLGMVEQFISPELVNRNKPSFQNSSEVLIGYHPGAMLIKRDAFNKIGLFNETLKVSEVIEWFARANEANIKTKIIDSVVYKRRLHTSNQGILKKDLQKEYTSVLKEALKRRRQNT